MSISKSVHPSKKEPFHAKCSLKIPESFFRVNFLAKGKYQIYPNPTNTYLTIQQRTASVAYYILYNTIGQAVTKGTFNTPSHTISVEPLPAGIYYLQINGQCLKVVK